MLRPALALLVIGFCGRALSAQELRDDSIRTLKTASSFYRTQVASHGGYVYYYSLDLKDRWGEGKASPDILFVQPPGTPTVGMAYLSAYAATGDSFYLDAARETADALRFGQLQSGGWTQTIHYAPGNRVGKYRNGKGGTWNASSLDDGQTQAALLMLMRADQALSFKDVAIHEAAVFGLTALLKAQFPNGAFPQIWTGPVDATKPVLKARYPDYDWKTEGRVKNYWDYYTLNDGLAGSVAEVLIAAHTIYKNDQYRAALLKLGDFLMAAQMPDPQPGWCQQYNFEMVPIWARKFEPSAITGSESQDVMKTLIAISRHTGEKKYLESIPRALAYFKKCILPEGKIARYYEFKTNKPLYMDAAYQLTYDDSTAPSHYGWKQPAHFDEIEKAYQDAMMDAPLPRPRSAKELEPRVKQIVKDLDAEGRWVNTYNGERLVGQPKFANGFRYISSETFSRNVEVLSVYLLSGK